MSQSNPTNESRKSVIASELAWHEQEAHRRISLDTFLYDPPAFDAVVGDGFAFLRTPPGDVALEMGCGEGKESLQLAERGLLVISTDLSYAQLSRTRERLRQWAPDAPVFFVQANAEESPFAARSFGSIYGKAIIHHLDIDMAAEEIKRLLKPGGRATFAEPMAGHPLFMLGRWLTPQWRTRDEHPLTFSELRQFGDHFSRVEIREYFLLAPLWYVFRLLPGGESLFRRFHARLQRVDRRLFGTFAALREWAWYSLINVDR